LVSNHKFPSAGGAKLVSPGRHKGLLEAWVIPRKQSLPHCRGPAQSPPRRTERF